MSPQLLTARTHWPVTKLGTGPKVLQQGQASQICLLQGSAVGSLGCPLLQKSNDSWVRANHRLPNSCAGLKRPLQLAEYICLHTGLEPREPMVMAGKTITFLFESWGSLLCPSSFRPFSWTCTFLGVPSKPIFLFYSTFILPLVLNPYILLENIPPETVLLLWT